MNPLQVLNYVVQTTVAGQVALVGLTIFATLFVHEWYWTNRRADVDSNAHFAQATWIRRRLLFGGIVLFAVLYLVLLLK